MTKAVERTADHASSIAANILLLKNKLAKETMDMLECMSNIAVFMFEKAIEALFRQDYLLAESIIEKIEEVKVLEKETVSSLENMEIRELPQIRLIIESIRRIAEYASDISEVVLNLSVDSILS